MSPPGKRDGRLHSSRRILPKLIAALAVIAAITWLVVAAHTTTERIHRLNEALRAGTIGRLRAADASHLRSEVQWLAPYASITIPVVVNEPYRPGRLHVYTTSEAATSVTRCGRGNAVYDAQLDVVFLDETLVETDDFRSIYNHAAAGSVASMSELPFFTVFQRFVILHELGHRQLHRASGRLYDAIGTRDAKRDTAREREADAFALARLRAAYAGDVAAGFQHTASSAGEVIDLSLDRHEPVAERIAVDVAGMTAGMATFNLFLSTPYGPFYRDRAHPPFFARAQSALEGVLDAPLRPAVRAQVEFFDAFIARQAAAARAAAVEILCPEPIDNVLFGRSGLLIAANEYRHLYAVADRLLVHRDSIAPSTIRLDRPIAIAPASDAIEQWWMTDDRLHAWNGAAVLALDGHRWVSTAIAPGATSLDPLEFMVPGNATVLHATIGGLEHYVIPGPRGLVTVAAADIERAVRANSTTKNARIDLKGLAGNDLLFAVENDGALWGTAVVTTSPVTVRVHPLVLPGGVAHEWSARDLAVLPTRTGVRMFLVTVGRADDPHPMWEVWEVSMSTPRRVVAHDLLVDGLSRSSRALVRDGSPSLLSITPIAADELLLSLERDSMYAIDIARGSTHVVFQPGDSSFIVRNDGRGRVAVTVAGGHKVILLQTR